MTADFTGALSPFTMIAGGPSVARVRSRGFGVSPTVGGRMASRARSVLVVVVAGVVPFLVTASPTEGAASVAVVAPYGTFALIGDAARTFQLPADTTLLRQSRLRSGLRQTAYQQVADGVPVYGGQITVLADRAGAKVGVIGAYYPGLHASNAVAQSPAQARVAAEKDAGPGGHWTTKLWLTSDGTLAYEVDSVRGESRPSSWIDAQNGVVLSSHDKIKRGEGLGTKGDRKTISTVASNGRYLLRSADGRQETFDAGNREVEPGILMSDSDDVWDLIRGSRHSPDQRAAVDAHYYARVVDTFYRDVFGRNSLDDHGMTLRSTVHYGNQVCNSFWTGAGVEFGDGGDRGTCHSFAGDLDFVGHEFTHGVTEFTSNLGSPVQEGVRNEAGALNESFSDMMGSSMEFYAAEHGLDPSATPDWYMGEDVIIDKPFYPNTEPGFRNLSDPREDFQPDHYSEYVDTTDDDGGVHRNAAISSHAYYLAVAGGHNAGCDNIGSAGHTHILDCDVTVSPLGLDKAEQVFYTGFTSLTPWANFCDARNATVASAAGLYGAAAADSTGDAWAAVGVHSDCRASVQPPAPCADVVNANLPVESAHPYRNGSDCTWTYHHGSSGFAFHFSILDTEAGYDTVDVLDGDGHVLASYTGAHRKAVTSPCIVGGTGSVRLRTDSAGTAQGFTVDSIATC